MTVHGSKLMSPTQSSRSTRVDGPETRSLRAEGGGVGSEETSGRSGGVRTGTTAHITGGRPYPSFRSKSVLPCPFLGFCRRRTGARLLKEGLHPRADVLNCG